MAGLDTDKTRGWDFWRIIWLMPAVFAPHIAEEYYGGFPDWVTRVMGASFNNLAFALNNLAFMLILLALTFWASRTRSRLAAFLLIAWASGNLFWAALFHIFGTVFFGSYFPGTVTATLLYFPISLWVGWSALRQSVLSPAAFAGAVAVGLGLMGFVIWYGLFHFAL